MACEIKYPNLQCVCQFLFEWQTLTAGILALIAAGITVWATDKAAKRQVKAAQEQTRVTQEQIDVMKRMECQRIARESHAFLTTLEAALGTVLEDIKAARRLVPNQGPQGSVGDDAYAARKRIKKTAFADIRSACLRVSSELTAQFLQLEHEIDDYSARCNENLNQGEHGGLYNQLECIEKQADLLRKGADAGIKRCNKVLGETVHQEG
jgi:type II secretory pathway pseudopilin PulG